MSQTDFSFRVGMKGWRVSDTRLVKRFWRGRFGEERHSLVEKHQFTLQLIPVTGAFCSPLLYPLTPKL